MNRNDRYPRRNGIMPAYRSCGAYSESAGSAPRESGNENCLCDSQPISLAMAYVKDQPFGAVYSASEALNNGTLFPDLNKPYCIGGKRR